MELNKKNSALNSKFLDCKLSDRLSQNTKNGLKRYLFCSTNVHLERAAPSLIRQSKFYPNRSIFDSIVADNFSLVMRQLFLGLTIEPTFRTSISSIVKLH